MLEAITTKEALEATVASHTGHAVVISSGNRERSGTIHGHADGKMFLTSRQGTARITQSISMQSLLEEQPLTILRTVA